MLAHVFCASTYGVDAHLIDVETNISAGMPKYFLVGLPDRSISESRDRIEAALKNSSYDMPRGRITVNLAPADLPKEGSAFDLPIAVGFLAASRQLKTDKLKTTLILGELALDGHLRPVKGVLPIAVEAQNQGLENIIVPESNGFEAAVVKGIDVYAFKHLHQVIKWLQGDEKYNPVNLDVDQFFRDSQSKNVVDFRDVKGHGSGGCRRTQHHYGGSAGFGKNNAGKEASHDPATGQPG
jgi:magnesium chelatase family protein